MAQINVSINGRGFPIACELGEEDRLVDLARYVDHHVSELAQKVGQVGDARLLLMASLLIADELAEAVSRLEDAQEKLSRLEAASKGDGDAAARVEAIAAALESA